ncbi:MAG: VWA domain-containing protein [Acidobacteria bacterium]|nr:MAG: VWA domain-containing protein [Acidobacteriota bacterium]PYY09427.1 MAG: VWA domain-containing protein [Acidobacteriota bacterium]
MQDQASRCGFRELCRSGQPERFSPDAVNRTTLALLILLFVLGFSVVTCPAQLAGNSGPLGSPVFTVSKEVQEVNLVLTVTNRWGHFVHNLTESDLSILDNDRPVEKITYFQPQTDLPLRVALVVDTSSSIIHRFGFEQKAATAFLHRVLRHDSDLALVIGFNQQVTVAQPATEDMNLLSAGLKKLKPEGETAVYDGVSVACQELMHVKDNQPSRRAIILITDGEDNHSRIGLQQAVERALRVEAVVYVLSTNPEYTISLAEEGDRSMRHLAEATGGRLLRADSQSDVASAFSKIAKELRSQYAIGYKPANQGPDGLFHRLSVLGPKKFHLFHRSGYYAR